MQIRQTRFGFSKPSSEPAQSNCTKSRPIVMCTADATKQWKAKANKKKLEVQEQQKQKQKRRNITSVSNNKSNQRNTQKVLIKINA